MILHYNILIIKRIKYQSYFRENMYVFWETNNEIVKTFGKIYNNPMASRTWKNFLPSRKNSIFHEQIR